MQLLGRKIGSFKDKETQNTIEYCHLYVIDDKSEDKNVQGCICETLKISSAVINQVREIPIGSEIHIAYNKFGKVAAVKQV